MSVLRHPPFALLVGGQTVSQLGDKLHHMALIALVGAGASAHTGGLELAKLSVVFTAPVILFGPLAGALVDRWNKRATMIVADLLRAALVLSIPWLFRTTGHLYVIYVVAFFVFMLGLFFNSAKMALIPELVRRDELLSANAALAFVGRFATIAGIVGGGVLIAMPHWRRFGWAPHDAGFYLDGISFLISVVTLLGTTAAATAASRAPSAPSSAAVPARRRVRDLAHDVKQTLRVVRSDPALRFTFGTVIVLAFFAATVYVVMTVSVQTVLGKGTAGVGYLGGLLAAGMVAGSFAVGSFGHRAPRVALITWCNVVIGFLMIAAGLLFSFKIFAPVALFGGALLAVVMIAQDTLLHEHAPAASRAVVFSSKDLIVAAVFAAAAFLVGGTVYLLGAVGILEPYRWALVGVGGAIAAASLGWGVTSRRALDHVSESVTAHEKVAG